MQDRERDQDLELLVKLKFIGNIKFIKMKKIFITLVLILIVNSIKAQGNLQFNQVKNVEITGTTLPNTTQIGNPISTLGSITIPIGKVWKIESVTGIKNGQESNDIFGTHVRVLIGNHKALVSPGDEIIMFPIWLSAGNYPIKAGSNPLDSLIISISAIEFNIVP